MALYVPKYSEAGEAGAAAGAAATMAHDNPLHRGPHITWILTFSTPSWKSCCALIYTRYTTVCNRLLRQYFYFCTSKAGKVRTSLLATVPQAGHAHPTPVRMQSTRAAVLELAAPSVSVFVLVKQVNGVLLY